MVVDCGPLNIPMHGVLTAPKTTTGAVASYSCTAGYDLLLPAADPSAASDPSASTTSSAEDSSEGDALISTVPPSGVVTRTCLESGVWAGGEPTCTRESRVQTHSIVVARSKK